MINRILFIFLLIASVFLNAQNESCVEYKQTGFTAHHPKTFPIFPGCEEFKENNDSLNYCLRNQLANLIANKIEGKVKTDAEIDSLGTTYFRTDVFIKIDAFGKLDMFLIKKSRDSFEEKLVEKLSEISNETSGIIPAKMENGFCTRFTYKLPIRFDLTE